MSSSPDGLIFGDCLTLEHGTDMMSQNVGNYKSVLCNIPGEWRSCIWCASSMVSV